MDPVRFSLVAHGDMTVWNPVAGETFDGVLGRAGLPGDARILDVGCGPAGLLLRALAVHPGATAVAVDRAGPVVALAREAVAAAGAMDRVTLREESFDAGRFPAASFDLVLCVGASHAAGGPAEAPSVLAPLLRPGGWLLLGEGFWEREPDPAYLAFLGAARGEYLDIDGTAARGGAAGLSTECAVPCPREDWDRYEGAYASNVERFVAAHPDDRDAAAMLARIRPWREAYLRWGSTTLGFALVLHRRG